ncbi:hypothetical protein SEVIR_6G118550v4 [Setaria viridis]
MTYCAVYYLWVGLVVATSGKKWGKQTVVGGWMTVLHCTCAMPRLLL